MNEVTIDAIYKLGNNEAIKEKCEPNVVRRLPLEKWMIERVVYCIDLLGDEWDNECKCTKKVKRTAKGNKKATPTT